MSLSELNLVVRWACKKDYRDVLKIQAVSFPDPWDDVELKSRLQGREVVGRIADVCGAVVAFSVYFVNNEYIHLQRIAVRPDFRRRGIGTILVNELKGNSSRHRRRFVAQVRETNLDAAKFFRASGMKARLDRGKFPDTGEDAYVFDYDPKTVPVHSAAGEVH